MTKERTTDKFHALQLFTDTFSAETVHLTNEEVGIYTRLLNFHWTKNAKPFTAHQAHRICQCKSAECEFTVDSILREFFIKSGKSEDGNQLWSNKRVFSFFACVIICWFRSLFKLVICSI